MKRIVSSDGRFGKKRVVFESANLSEAGESGIEGQNIENDASTIVNDRQVSRDDLSNRNRQGSFGGSGAYRNRQDDGVELNGILNDPKVATSEKYRAFSDYLKNRYKNQYSVVSPAGEALFRIYSEIGSLPSSNPFVTYLDRYVSRNPSGRLSISGIDALNDLYANYDINPEDLMGNTPDGRMSVFFNDSLMRESKDNVRDVVLSYIWLSNPSNVKKVDFRSILKSQDTNVIRSGIAKTIRANDEFDAIVTQADSFSSEDQPLPTTPAEWRDAIIFVDGDPKKQIRKPVEISSILKEGSRGFAGKENKQQRNEREAKNFTDWFNSLDDNEKKQALMNLYGNIESTLNSLLKDNKIKLS